MDPTSEENHRILGLVLTQQGRYDEAVAAFREAIAGASESAYARGALARTLAMAGRTAEARRTARGAGGGARTRYVSPVALATANIALGDADEAFRWIERARAERRGWLAYLRVEPIFDPIRGDAAIRRSAGADEAVRSDGPMGDAPSVDTCGHAVAAAMHAGATVCHGVLPIRPLPICPSPGGPT